MNNIISFFAFLLIKSVFTIEDYCLVDKYVTNGTHMQFTKEPNVEEFAINGKFKGLHCCAKNYRSIEWSKDGKPYPWYLPASRFILYPESGNQTIYTQSISKSDAGNYTCLLRNDTSFYIHTITLQVYDNIPEEPKITFMPSDAEVAIGQDLRLFCEAFGGRIDLPDAYNEAVWSKLGTNTSLSNMTRIKQKKTSREDDQTFGTYLIIENVQPGDFGKYVCTISKPGKTKELCVRVQEKIEVEYLNPNPFPTEKMLIVLTVLILMCITAVVLNMKFGLLLRIRYKNAFAPLEENDGKTNDVLILYSEKDSEIAVGIVLPKLETLYNYKCGCRKLSSNVDNWFLDLKKPSEKSRRIIAVLSPSCVNENWDSLSVYNAIKQLCCLEPKLTCIALKPLPINSNETKNSQGETLKSVLNLIHVVDWIRPLNENWWLNLCLRLPPKRHASNVSNISIAEQGSSRLTTINDIQESMMDDLV